MDSTNQFNIAARVIIKVNGESIVKDSPFDQSITLKEGDQVMATNVKTTEVVVKFVPSK